MNPPLEWQQTLHGTVAELPFFFERLEAWADDNGVPMPLASSFGLMLDELLTNVAMHGYAGQGGLVEVHVRFDAPARLQAVLRDHGRAFDPTTLAAPDVGASLDDRDIGGLGVHFVPEERLGRGAVPTLGLAHNLLLTRDDALGKTGWIDVKSLATQARSIIERYNVKAGGPQAAAKSLSGGNLQKFIVGREIDAAPKLLIVSQPTWGVDVGASAQIRGAILALRDAGCAVLVVSEELDELFEISDRLHVIAKGRMSPSVDRAAATVAQIGEWMSGLWDHPASKPAANAAKEASRV